MVIRTVVFPIYLTQDQENALNETIKLYTLAWRICLDFAWDNEILSVKKVHKQTYYEIKEKLNLKSQYICSARNRAIETVRGMFVLKSKKKKTCKPEAKIIPIRLDKNTLSFDEKRENISITTQSGRIKVSLIWHKQALRYKSWDCKAGEIGIDKKGRWVVRLIFTQKVNMPERTNHIVGVDRGIKHKMVTSDNRFLGRPEWREHERKILSLISKLQSKGTKSAKRHLKKLAGRLRRFKNDCDRILAKELLSILYSGDTVVLEDLTNIRTRCGTKGNATKTHRANMSRWSFERQKRMIQEYAELLGIYVEFIRPHYTSQKCSRCETVLKSNRKTQSRYICSCGLNLNADLNASRNIAKEWCVANGITFGLSVNQPIVANLKNSVTSFRL